MSPGDFLADLNLPTRRPRHYLLFRTHMERGRGQSRPCKTRAHLLGHEAAVKLESSPWLLVHTPGLAKDLLTPSKSCKDLSGTNRDLISQRLSNGRMDAVVTKSACKVRLYTGMHGRTVRGTVEPQGVGYKLN